MDREPHTTVSLRDRLTSRGWTWHQGLVRYLDVEETMFQCTGGCKSCDAHSEELESATRYARRSIQQPMPHMDAVAGERLRTLTNRELGDELDRWADRRDNFPNLDSLALRVTADRLRAMEEGCDHPLAYLYRNETQEFCQKCGAIVNALGETLNKWTCEESGVYSAAPPRGGSRADGPLLRPSVPRTSCGVTTEHDSHGAFNTDRRCDTYCSGRLIDDSKGGDVRGMPSAENGDVIIEGARCLTNLPDEDDEADADKDGPSQGERDCPIRGYDDEESGGPWLPVDVQTGHCSTDANGDGRWWLAHEGVNAYELHFHSGSLDAGGDIPPTNHRHFITPIQPCAPSANPHAPHTHRQGSRFCQGVTLPETRCYLRIRHEAHDSNWNADGPTRHCDGKGRNV